MSSQNGGTIACSSTESNSRPWEIKLGKEEDKYDEEYNKHPKNLDHEPSIGWEWLEVSENFRVGSIHIQ